jgi:hypothetical protein
MLRRVHVWLAFLVSSVLAMPQGWCCLVMTLGCCQAAPVEVTESQASCCCCQSKTPTTKSCCPTGEQPREGSKQPAGKCTLCIAAAFKPPVKQAQDNPPTLAYLLPVLDASSAAAIEVLSFLAPREPGPPRHLLLCVWRC